MFEFSVAVCSTIEVNIITTTEYYPEANALKESFDTKIVSQLRHYVYDYYTD